MTDPAEKAKLKLRKLLKHLADIKGRHTELVSVYIPAGYSLHEMSSQLRQEQSTSENIKSKPVRKNVTSAIEKILRNLQLYRQTPVNGLAMFCGNTSEKEGTENIELFAIEPPEPIKVKMYWCDQRFVMEPLEEMISEKEIYGIICLDRSEFDVGLLVGKKLEPFVHMESIVPGKTRAGGQSSARFERVREGLLNDWLKQVGDIANKFFMEHKETLGILLGGPGPIKEFFMKEDYLFTDVKKRILGTVDTSYTGEYGLNEVIERGRDLIKEASVLREKRLLQKFFEGLQKPHGLVVYGLQNVLGAIEKGAVDTVILSEKIELFEVEYECACGTKKKFVTQFEKNKQVCETCNQLMRVLGEKDMIDAIADIAGNYGSRLEVVSADTPEGKQFFELGGIGAMLRYGI